ncbi:nuclear transport factor 2 family protein [Lampropedia puyangensis]|uniref:Nuclear transport factor 2 family protein n=1 Tax=Lampropedia puyangensis TaxID=1330072 RepID=A0A4S8EWT5_9BURK|nr:nuclear transport factor 2 family protein [Lampropedia puyangensis]THT98750.1 nuclear transport factor 2 family protein [Lampropedia puyangensis]
MTAITIATALNEILNRLDIPIDDILDRHFSPDYRQRTNGQWDDREAFSQHLHALRKIVALADIEILDELRDGNRYADRHRVHITKHNGEKVVQEVYLFAQLDDAGRFTRIEETTLMLEGAESDRAIGCIK